MNRTKTVLIGASALVAGAVIAGGVNLASAATGGDDSTPDRYGMPRGYGFGPGDFGRDGDGRGHGMMGGHEHTEVTGSERTKVVDAVTAKYADVEVVDVRQDEDGSYDVMGTQDGTPVMVEVSKDLKTIELRTGGPGDGRGFGPGGPGMGMHDHTPVTGAERTKVVDAVTEKYADVEVLMVVQDEDGSYDVMGVKDDQPVRIEVSKDLTTVELSTGGPGGMHGSATPSSDI